MTRLPLALLSALALAPVAVASPPARVVDQALAFEAMHNPDPAVRARISSWLAHPGRIATDARAGSWVASDGEYTLVNGRVHRQSLGGDPWVRIDPSGAWVAGGAQGVLVSGRVAGGAGVSRSLRAALMPWAVSGPSPLSTRVPLLRQPTPLALPSQPTPVDIVRDTIPPVVVRLELVLHPTDPARRVVVPAGPGTFVGFEPIGIRVTMSEHMGSPPKVRIRQPNLTPLDASLTDASLNPVFEYTYFPAGAPQNNGPATVEVLGERDGVPPDFGFDDAGNPIPPGSSGSTVARAFGVDTVPPDVRRVDLRQPGAFRMLPPENSVLPKNGFPREIMVLVADYNRPDDGTFTPPNLATDQASGIDFNRIGNPGDPIRVRLFDPRGREIRGLEVGLSPTALKLLLPDVYDPAAGVFPDTDGDGRADPIEGQYRVQVDLVDRAGNVASRTLPFGADTTPIGGRSIAVSIRPVFTTPFINPVNPIADRGSAVKKLERVEITSPDPDFDPLRSTARLLSGVPGPGGIPRPMRTTLTREGRTLILTVDRDQDGDGRPDFENPPPGAFLPPGTIDPRLGRNDGAYIVEVTAFDVAGNSSLITREILLDTTNPVVDRTFPAAAVTMGPPLRIVDALLMDPRATSSQPGSGVHLDFSSILLRFRGNGQTPPQVIRGMVFVHVPNDSDPTRPDFNPNDHFPKILYEIVDRNGDVTALPRDGSFDGVYELAVTVRDRAGNEASGITSFTYSSKTTPTTAVLTIAELLPVRPPPGPVPGTRSDH